jgi:hypothetical protein
MELLAQSVGYARENGSSRSEFRVAADVFHLGTVRW